MGDEEATSDEAAMGDEEEQFMTIAGALGEAAESLRAAGVGEARREAGSLLAHVTGRDRAYFFAHDDERLAPERLAAYRRAVARRAAGEPLQYIRGSQEFYGLDFEVTPDVLIPRPETELLVETALELLRDTPAPSVCDVGAGSGCIIISILRERADARGAALDISPAALAVARRNAERHGVAGRLTFLESDCFDALDPRDADALGAASPGDVRPGAGRFDLIASNPPYVAEDALAGLQREVRDHEPRVALTPGGDGLSIIRRLAAESPRRLKPGGHLLMEIGYDQHERVAALVNPRVWTLLDIHPDLQGIPRTVALRLKE
jgi:release factor glutamine methyltransferase